MTVATEQMKFRTLKLHSRASPRSPHRKRSRRGAATLACRQWVRQTPPSSTSTSTILQFGSRVVIVPTNPKEHHLASQTAMPVQQPRPAFLPPPPPPPPHPLTTSSSSPLPFSIQQAHQQQSSHSNGHPSATSSPSTSIHRTNGGMNNSSHGCA